MIQSRSTIGSALTWSHKHKEGLSFGFAWRRFYWKECRLYLKLCTEPCFSDCEIPLPTLSPVPLDFGFPSQARGARQVESGPPEKAAVMTLPSSAHGCHQYFILTLSHWVQTKPLRSSWRDAPGSFYLRTENGNRGDILCPPDALSRGCPLCLLSSVIFNIHFGSELSPFVYYLWNLFKSDPS